MHGAVQCRAYGALCGWSIGGYFLHVAFPVVFSFRDGLALVQVRILFGNVAADIFRRHKRHDDFGSNVLAFSGNVIKALVRFLYW